MSSPADRNTTSASSSKYEDNSPPLYPSTDRFQPLGYSTPQPQQRGHSSQAKNYFSVQPKHMLPKTRGFHNRHRYGQNEFHDRSHGSTQEANVGDHNDRAANSHMDAGRQNYGRSWRGHQNRNQRYGGQRHQHNFRQKHQARGAPYNIEDYYHPSMLEDPWEFFFRNSTKPTERTARHVEAGDSSDNAEEG